MNIILAISHGIIALTWVAITIFFWKHLIRPRKGPNKGWRSIAAGIALTFFSFGAYRDEVRIASVAWQGKEIPHPGGLIGWHDAASVSITATQAVAGLIFIFLVGRWVRISIIDKRYFDDVVKEDVQRTLDRRKKK